MSRAIYWHTCGLREIYPNPSEETKHGDMIGCPEMGVSPEGTACIVFVEVAPDV